MLRDRVGEQGQEVANLLQSFIGPLEQWPDQQVDRHLVRTFLLALAAMCACATPGRDCCSANWVPTCSPRPRLWPGPSGSAICCALPSGATHSWRGFSGKGRTRNLPRPRIETSWPWPSGTRGCWRSRHRKTGVVAVPVRHPQLGDELWLVVSRPRQGAQTLVPADQRAHGHLR